MFQTLQNWWQGLRNFFLYKSGLLTDEGHYPTIILPQSNYKNRIDLDELLNEEEIFIVRKADFFCEDCFNEAGILRDHVIELKRIPNLSFNLLGAFYKLKHIKFRVKGDGAKSWKGGSSISFSNFKKDYLFSEPTCPLVYHANLIHDKQIPYICENNKERLKFVKAFKVPFQETNKTLTLHGYTKIEHDPTNLNYWRVVLNLYINKNRPLKKVENHIENTLCTFVLEHFLSVPLMPPTMKFKQIPKKHYLIKL